MNLIGTKPDITFQADDGKDVHVYFDATEPMFTLVVYNTEPRRFDMMRLGLEGVRTSDFYTHDEWKNYLQQAYKLHYDDFKKNIYDIIEVKSDALKDEQQEITKKITSYERMLHRMYVVTDDD